MKERGLLVRAVHHGKLRKLADRLSALRTLFGAALPLALAGCAGTPAFPGADATHPANPDAAASPMPPLQPSLLAVTNVLLVTPGTQSAPEHQHDHEKPEAKPKTGGEK